MATSVHAELVLDDDVIEATSVAPAGSVVIWPELVDSTLTYTVGELEVAVTERSVCGAIAPNSAAELVATSGWHCQPGAVDVNVWGGASGLRSNPPPRPRETPAGAPSTRRGARSGSSA